MSPRSRLVVLACLLAPLAAPAAARADDLSCTQQTPASVQEGGSVATELQCSGGPPGGFDDTIAQQPTYGQIAGGTSFSDEGKARIAYAANAHTGGHDDSYVIRVTRGSASTDVPVSLHITARTDDRAPVCSDPDPANPGRVSVDRNGLADVGLPCSDPDGDALSYSIPTPPTSGTAAIETAGIGLAPEQPVLAYRPALDHVGPDHLVLRATDPQGASSDLPLEIDTVPFICGGGATFFGALRTREVGNVSLVCDRPGGDPTPSSVAVVEAPAHGSVGAPFVDGSGSGTLPYTPAAGTTTQDADAFTVRVTRGPDHVDVRLPVAFKDPGSDVPPNCEESSPGLELIAGETGFDDDGCHDVDGDTLTLTLLSGPAHGAARIETGATGRERLVYVPAPGFHGTDSVRLRADDGHGGIVETTRQITVRGFSCAVGDWAAGVRSGGTLALAYHCDEGPGVTPTVTATPGSGPLRVTGVSGPDENGDGTVSILAPAGTPAGMSGVAITARDAGDSQTSSPLLHISPADGDGVPRCVHPRLVAPAGRPTAIALSCTDPDGDPVAVTVTDGPAHGALSPPDADGLRYYTPAGDGATDDRIRFVGSAHGADDPSVVELHLVGLTPDAVQRDALTGETVPLHRGRPNPAQPVVASALTPQAGLLSLRAEGGALTLDAPAGAGVRQLRLAFDASTVPAGTTAATVGLRLDGAVIPDCRGAVTPASATSDFALTTPTADPCVSRRQALTGGDVRLVLLSSRAGRFTLGPASPSTTPASRARLTLRVGRVRLGGLRLATALRRGLRVPVRCSRRCAARVVVRVDRATARRAHLGRRATIVARGRATGTGSLAVRVRFTARARHRLVHLRRVRLTLAVTATAPGSPAAHGAAAVTLRR